MDVWTIFLLILFGPSVILLLLVMAGIIVAPIAALTGRRPVEGQSDEDVITPKYAAMTAMLMLLPYIYLVLRSMGKTPPKGLVETAYAILSGMWILGLLIVWIVLGVLLPAIAVLVLLTFGQGSSNEGLLPIFMLILLGGIAICVACVWTWNNVRSEFASFEYLRFELHRQPTAPERSARLPRGYLRPFVYTTMWTLVTALGAPAYAIFQVWIFL